MKLLSTALVLLAALALTGSAFSNREYDEADLRATMQDVDVWAGLSVPTVQPKLRNPSAHQEAKMCLALNAWHEARGESFEGQVAVGQVAVRRAGFQAKNVCREIYRDGQFSWTEHWDGTMPQGATWQWALAAAEQTLQWANNPEKHIDYSNGAYFFHAVYVNPRWSRSMELATILGAHRFYKVGG